MAGFRFRLSYPNRGIAGLRLCVLAFLWIAATPVAAQDRTTAAAEFRPLSAAMTVDPGATCLDFGEMVKHVSNWLGTDRLAAPIAIEVHGSPHFERTVWFRIQRGDVIVAERRFEPAPARCEALHAAVGLAIALALKASLDESLDDARTTDEAHASRSFRISARALGGSGVVPGADFGVGLGLQHSLAEPFAARLAIFALVGPHGDFQSDRGRFETWLGVGRLDVCARLAELLSVGISACVGVAAGGLRATGEAFPISRRELIAYVALANALEFEIELGTRWSLDVAIDVLVPLRRPSFVVRDQAGAVLAAHDLAPAGVLIAIGPAYRF